MLAEVPTPVVVAAVTMIGGLLVGFATAVVARRSAKDSRELGLIHAGQETLVGVISELRAENARLMRTCERIPVLEQQISAMRNDLAEALANYSNCEEARHDLLAEIRRMRGIEES